MNLEPENLKNADVARIISGSRFAKRFKVENDFCREGVYVMQSNKADEYLEGVKTSLQYYREQIETIRTRLTSTAVDLTRYKNYPYGVQSTPNPDALLDAVVRILDFENKLSSLTEEATDFIKQLHNENRQRILILLYIDNTKVVEISRMINCSCSYIYRVCRESTVQLSEYL